MAKIPYELMVDKDGLSYYNDDRILLHAPLSVDPREVNENRQYPYCFYSLYGTDDYVIKYTPTYYSKKDVKKIKNMLLKFMEIQGKITDIEFPIGYFKEGRRLGGQIIRFYEDGVSYESVLNKKDIQLIRKYYDHDEDTLHNMFLIFYDVLNLIYELFENGVYYMDINPGNIILYENVVKLIDFDHRFIAFDEKDKRLKQIMDSYAFLLKFVLMNYNLIGGLNGELKNFEQAKEFTKKLENITRKNWNTK